MPPKNKGNIKKPAKARTPTLIDGLTKEEISKEQMEEHIVRLREELDREREERNYFQLERDKIHAFWKITERQVEELKAEKKILDKDIEDDEGRHQVELKVYKQKMKHLLCEHQNAISELKADGLVSTEAMKKEQERLETELHKKKKAVMVDAQELDNEDLVELELKHNEEMTKTRNTWEKHLTEVKAKYETKMKSLPQELDNMRKSETSEIEDHWNSHIATLIDDHRKAFSEANALVHCMQEDVDMNNSLKKQIKDTNMRQKEKEKDHGAILQDNKHLADLLSKVKEEVAEYEKKLKYRTVNKDTCEKVKKKELKDLKSSYEALEMKFSKMQLERDELYNAFTQNIQRLQDKGGVKLDLLQRKLNALTDSLEKTQAQLSSVLSASNMDQAALGGVTNEIETHLDSQNNSMKNLQYKKAQTLKTHKDLLLTYEAKQRALGIPVEDVCVKPFESSVTERHPEQDLESRPCPETKSNESNKMRD